MKDWIPIPGSIKEQLITIALEEFKKKEYKEVNISQLANEANVTTGAIYHHFGSKIKLYLLIRNEMEQRIIDRMEGAAALFEDDPNQALTAAVKVGIDACVKLDCCKLLSELPSDKVNDRIGEFMVSLNKKTITGIEYILLPSWRSLLNAIYEKQIDRENAKQLISRILK
ncbi:TetR/AcrR family transcriptional regulator [Chengkuizengella axinellae]|uniref:TetR/AcrR family transcriptional regulator n=1 Tax=Chengkuizengella axinellae TaxID=3064388 RepID=A0ABT9J1T5_9BACL|nr:TetR/AcrR family transcriptional regulator [Chengkuizengella sp. 2205SS18-9]MDP5275387.1 TetR/AcrR family transcriptional regulator [Chengkuizengella sp. 2205SS18-9]